MNALLAGLAVLVIGDSHMVTLAAEAEFAAMLVDTRA